MPHQLLGEIGLQRQQEIIRGDHAITYPPLYTVYEEIVTVCECDTQYNQSTTIFQESKSEYRRFCEDGGWINASPDDKNADTEKMIDDIEYGKVVRCFFHDRFVTVCFTREAAVDYIARDGHNLQNPRIWVNHIHDRNTQLKSIAQILGDK